MLSHNYRLKNRCFDFQITEIIIYGYWLSVSKINISIN